MAATKTSTKSIEGVIVNYRRGRRTMQGNQMIVEVKSIKKPTAAKKFMGRKVIYTTSGGRKLIGKVMATHGNSGALRVRFHKGMPGQSIGQKVEIQE